MKRRKFVGGVGLVAAGMLAWEAINNDDIDDIMTEDGMISIEAPSVKRGGSDPLRISATSVITLRVNVLSSTGEELFRFSEASISPDPDITFTIKPPTWRWSSPSDVHIDIPVHVPKDVSESEYEYEVSLKRGEEPTEVRRAFSILIRE